MLKMACVQAKKSNLYWFTFIDEFSKRSYGGRTFNTMIEAVNYANDEVVYRGETFDLVSINQPEYSVIDSMEAY